jgi:hypothetical protein
VRSRCVVEFRNSCAFIWTTIDGEQTGNVTRPYFRV